MSKQIVLYDDRCKLCNAIKRRIEKEDSHSIFHFVAQNSLIGRQYIRPLRLSKKEENSIIYIENTTHYTKSAAVLRILKQLGKYRMLYCFFRIFPESIRNIIYDLTARLRNRFKKH